jgi:hypothetical protein
MPRMCLAVVAVAAMSVVGGERDGNRRLLRRQLYARRLLRWWHFYNGLCGAGKI